MAESPDGMTPLDVPEVSEVVRDSLYDPLILMPAGWEEFPIKAVIQSLGKTYIDWDERGGRVFNKSIIPVSYGSKGNLGWEDFQKKQRISSRH